MHAEHVEAVLADATAEKMKNALRKKRELVIKRKFLMGKLEKIINAIERRKIEMAVAADDNTPPTPGSQNETQAEIMQLMHELTKKHGESREPIEEIENKLKAAEIQIQSLESLYFDVDKN